MLPAAIPCPSPGLGWELSNGLETWTSELLDSPKPEGPPCDHGLYETRGGEYAKGARQRSRPLRTSPPPGPAHHFGGIAWAIKWILYVFLACLILYYLLAPIIVSIIASIIAALVLLD